MKGAGPPVGYLYELASVVKKCNTGPCMGTRSSPVERCVDEVADFQATVSLHSYVAFMNFQVGLLSAPSASYYLQSLAVRPDRHIHCSE